MTRTPTLTSKDIRNTVQMPQATRFCDPPTIISPRAVNCWTACAMLTSLGPKQRPPLAQVLSNSAVRRMTSCIFGSDVSTFDLSSRKIAFYLVERSASKSETAWANRMSDFSWAADASARAIMEITALVKDLFENICWKGICQTGRRMAFLLGLGWPWTFAPECPRAHWGWIY